MRWFGWFREKPSRSFDSFSYYAEAYERQLKVTRNKERLRYMESLKKRGKASRSIKARKMQITTRSKR